jgi:hypothetical protein
MADHDEVINVLFPNPIRLLYRRFVHCRDESGYDSHVLYYRYFLKWGSLGYKQQPSIRTRA